MTTRDGRPTCIADLDMTAADLEGLRWRPPAGPGYAQVEHQGVPYWLLRGGEQTPPDDIHVYDETEWDAFRHALQTGEVVPVQRPTRGQPRP